MPFWKPENNPPGKLLADIADSIPGHYRQHRQFIYFSEFIAAYEWGLALECLIELANETEHFFPGVFWNDLADCADKMGMTDEAEYCRGQIDIRTA